MKKLFVLAIACVAFLSSCDGGKNTCSTGVADSATIEETPGTAEVVEVYTGVIPAASAPGYEVTLSLMGNGTYNESRLAQKEGAELEFTQGTFVMEGDTLVLTPDGGAPVLRGLLSAESIQLLDADGNLPELPYVLKLQR